MMLLEELNEKTKKKSWTTVTKQKDYLANGSSVNLLFPCVRKELGLVLVARLEERSR